eukprot:scaffold874_cov196-Alexandrium_tamarense.AAC.17
MSIHAGYPTDGDAPSQHKQQTTPRETTLLKTVSSTTITRTTKCLPVAPSSTTKSRRQLLYVRLTLRLLLKQTWPIARPEYSRMKTAFKSHRVEFLDAK